MAKVKKKNALSVYDVYLDKKRVVEKNELANISKKINDGFLDTEWFRRNMFNATSSGTHQEYKKYKMIYENIKTGERIYISHPLHQRHADALSLVLTDYDDIIKNKDGTITILTSLYRIAKKMGYKYPEKNVFNVKKFLDNIRLTDFKVVNKSGTYNFQILGESEFSNIHGKYIVELGSKSARVLSMHTGFKIDKELIEKLVVIPNKYPKIKALIRYVVSNTVPIRGYYSMTSIFEKYGIGMGENDATNRKDKSNFRKELSDHKEILCEFGITYDRAEDKIYYKDNSFVTFEMGINPQKVIEVIEKRNNEKDPYEALKNVFIRLPNNEIVEILEIIKIDGEDNSVSVDLYNHVLRKPLSIKEITLGELKELIDEDATEYYITQNETSLNKIKDNAYYQGKKIRIRNVLFTIKEIREKDNIFEAYLYSEEEDKAGWSTITSIENLNKLIIEYNR